MCLRFWIHVCETGASTWCRKFTIRAPKSSRFTILMDDQSISWHSSSLERRGWEIKWLKYISLLNQVDSFILSLNYHSFSITWCMGGRSPYLLIFHQIRLYNIKIIVNGVDHPLRWSNMCMMRQCSQRKFPTLDVHNP